ncbi:hypothetical protein JOB18_026881 [Solea senegalensis]|uniref:Uncharacterized protein n=1 Tax=Solea senegalensis TaxID=28829 RepID=A0AAV6RU19_SOLSE|nr:hypothetical protein JOB18_026881 [Solea senegalensis]
MSASGKQMILQRLEVCILPPLNLECDCLPLRGVCGAVGDSDVLSSSSACMSSSLLPQCPPVCVADISGSLRMKTHTSRCSVPPLVEKGR